MINVAVFCFLAALGIAFGTALVMLAKLTIMALPGSHIWAMPLLAALWLFALGVGFHAASRISSLPTRKEG